MNVLPHCSWHINAYATHTSLPSSTLRPQANTLVIRQVRSPRHLSLDPGSASTHRATPHVSRSAPRTLLVSPAVSAIKPHVH